MDPFSEGISFRVRPPKKSWKYITNLSGGEKTLSSLSLVYATHDVSVYSVHPLKSSFALHTYKPNPIYIMDEIDAALDFKNVSIVANYIKERTKVVFADIAAASVAYCAFAQNVYFPVIPHCLFQGCPVLDHISS